MPMSLAISSCGMPKPDSDSTMSCDSFVGTWGGRPTLPLVTTLASCQRIADAETILARKKSGVHDFQITEDPNLQPRAEDAMAQTAQIKTEYIMTLHGDLEPPQAIDAATLIFNVKGGWVEGPRIKGKAL